MESKNSRRVKPKKEQKTKKERKKRRPINASAWVKWDLCSSHVP
jgi:hypothetical protein